MRREIQCNIKETWVGQGVVGPGKPKGENISKVIKIK